MAFTRKFLTALGIEADKVDEIIDAHMEIVNAIKTERDDFEKTAKQLPEIQKKLEDAEKKVAKYGDEELIPKKDYDTLKTEYDKYKEDITSKETRSAKENAFRELLKAAGVSEKRINSIIKVSDIDGIELSDDGKISDAEKRTENIKTEWADFIETTEKKGAEFSKPPKNDKTTKDDFELGFDGE